MPRTSRHRRPGRAVARSLLLSLCLLAGTAQGARFEPKKAFPDGWDANVAFGAQATSGVSRTSTVSGSTELTYRGGRWENRLVFKALYSSSRAHVPRRDAAGKKVLDEGGEIVRDVVRDRTNDRRFLSLHPRWYFQTDRTYLFAIIDAETNEPVGIDFAARQIGGVGLRLWRDKSNYFTAGVGFGRKRLAQVSGETETGGISYVGLNFVRLLGERMTLEAKIDSDFGDENRYTELTLGLSWRFSEPVSLKLGYEVRMNSDVPETANPFYDGLDARSTVSLEIDVL